MPHSGMPLVQQYMRCCIQTKPSCILLTPSLPSPIPLSHRCHPPPTCPQDLYLRCRQSVFCPPVTPQPLSCSLPSSTPHPPTQDVYLRRTQSVLGSRSSAGGQRIAVNFAVAGQLEELRQVGGGGVDRGECGAAAATAPGGGGGGGGGGSGLLLVEAIGACLPPLLPDLSSILPFIVLQSTIPLKHLRHRL